MIALSVLRTEIRLATGQDSDDLPDSDADLLLNRTYWEILEKLHVKEVEASTTFATVIGQREYTLPPSFESLRLSAAVDPDSDVHTPLDVISIRDYEAKYVDNSDSQAVPTRYFRASGSIVLWPTPDAVYTIVLHYRSQLDDLSDSNIEAQLPKSWQELLIYGATARAFFRLNDYDKGKPAMSVYTQALNSAVPVEAKEEIDRAYAGAQPIRSSYP